MDVATIVIEPGLRLLALIRNGFNLLNIDPIYQQIFQGRRGARPRRRTACVSSTAPSSAGRMPVSAKSDLLKRSGSPRVLASAY